MNQFINKYIFKLQALLLALALLAVSSCDDLVDEQPISEIGAADFWKNNNDAALGVAAIYDGLQGTFRDKHYYWGEFRSDNFTYGSESASADNIELISNDVTSGNQNVLRWDRFYTMMNRVNLAIRYIPEIPNFNPDLLAEAYAVRAYAYFTAMRVWGSVPLFTEPIESATQELQKPRTDANTLMNEIIIADLTRAEELMTRIEDKFRFSLTTIWALQAEVAMWQKDYARAKERIEKIVESNEYSLVTSPNDWQNLFLNDLATTGKIMDGPELMLSIRYGIAESRDNPGQTRANRNGIFALFFAGLPSYYMSDTLENKWREKFPIDSAAWVEKYPDTDPVLTVDVNADGIPEKLYGDWRYYFSRENGTDVGSKEIGEARLAKYTKLNYSQDFDDSDQVIFRYAGMLYLLAEAENQLGNTDRALELVNEIRTARMLPLVTADEFGDDVDARENYILDERQIELLGEGKRWWDLRRTGKAIEVMNPILQQYQDEGLGGVPLTEERLLFPIFDEHLIENPLLEQTPGY